MFLSPRTPQTKKRNLTPPFWFSKAVVLLSGILFFSFALVVGFSSGNTPAVELTTMPIGEPQEIDYSRFRHSNPSHTRLPCLLCHRRDDNSPRIRFPGTPGHLPCAGCHAVQFSGNTSPMCTICHTDTGVKNFPGLQSFGVRFNHSRHAGVGCATCHKSAGRAGVGLSIPSGRSAHATCFQCHTFRSSGTMSSCDTCHQPGRLIRTSEWSPAYRKGFSHAEHSRGNKLSCTACHSVRAGSARGRQVSAPLVTMHFAPVRAVSCGGCHNDKRAFGTEDFSNCKRCHEGGSFKF